MRILPLLFLGLTLCCAGGRQNTKTGFDLESEPRDPTALSLAQDQADPAMTPLAMMETTVQLHIDMDVTLWMEDPATNQIKESKEKDGWVGSGVVYANDSSQSLILSANHVLETPAVGSIQPLKMSFMGMEIELGKYRVDAVRITLTTNDGRVCGVTPLRLGKSDFRDVATAHADCDAGRVAKIAKSTPAKGQKVHISGHPLGVPLPMVTEGYVSGDWRIADEEEDLGNFLLVSAPAYGGNSGGPVFYKGEVIGLLVRGSRTYPNISLVSKLEQVLLRIEDTPPL